jgi:hypothetical protein
MTDQQEKRTYSLNGENTILPMKFRPLFNYLFDHCDLFISIIDLLNKNVTKKNTIHGVQYYYSLPYLLKVLHIYDETIYLLAKEFYGLHDDSIEDIE